MNVDQPDEKSIITYVHVSGEDADSSVLWLPVYLTVTSLSCALPEDGRAFSLRAEWT